MPLGPTSFLFLLLITLGGCDWDLLLSGGEVSAGTGAYLSLDWPRNTPELKPFLAGGASDP